MISLKIYFLNPNNELSHKNVGSKDFYNCQDTFLTHSPLSYVNDYLSHLQYQRCSRKFWVFSVVQLVKNLPVTQEIWVLSLVWEDPLEKGKATYCSILAWRIPWTVQSTGSQRVGHNQVTFTFTTCHKFQNFNKQIKQSHVKQSSRDFPGSPVVKMSNFRCRRHRFNSWSGN